MRMTADLMELTGWTYRLHSGAFIRWMQPLRRGEVPKEEQRCEK